LLAETGFGEERIEKKRIQVEGVSARTIALGMIRGTPRSLSIEKRGGSLDDVVEKVAAALARAGGADPWRGHANAVVVEARAQLAARSVQAPQNDLPVAVDSRHHSIASASRGFTMRIACAPWSASVVTRIPRTRASSLVSGRPSTSTTACSSRRRTTAFAIAGVLDDAA
jgi:hypothetical protein